MLQIFFQFNPLRGWYSTELLNPRIPSAVNHIPTSGRLICRRPNKTALDLQIYTTINWCIVFCKLDEAQMNTDVIICCAVMALLCALWDKWGIRSKSAAKPGYLCRGKVSKLILSHVVAKPFMAEQILRVPQGQLNSARGIASGMRTPMSQSPSRAAYKFDPDGLSRPCRAHSSLFQSIPGRCPGLNLIWLSAINGFYSTFNPLRGWDTSELPNPRIPSAVNHIPYSGRVKRVPKSKSPKVLILWSFRSRIS